MVPVPESLPGREDLRGAYELDLVVTLCISNLSAVTLCLDHLWEERNGSPYLRKLKINRVNTCTVRGTVVGR